MGDRVGPCMVPFRIPFAKKKKPEEQMLENTLTDWVKRNPALVDSEFRIWYSLEYDTALSRSLSLSTLVREQPEKADDIVHKYVRYKLDRIRTLYPEVVEFIDSSSSLDASDRITAYMLFFYDEKGAYALLDELRRKGSFDNGTLNVLAEMFVWTLENKDRINSKSYYRLMHKRKPQHLDNETVARYVVRRFFDLYSSLNFSKEVPVKERHEQIYLVYTGTNIRKRLFHIHRESDMLLNTAVRMARKGMFELEHGPVRKYGFAYTEGFKTAYRFFVLHPEQIDPHAFKIWDLKRGGTGSLTSYMFGEKAKVIREFVEYRWKRIEETYPEALEFIGKLPREDQEYAYLAMAVSPEGTSSILRCLAEYRENGGVITPGMFRTVWDMYAWAHDHWRRVNGRRYRQLTGRRKTRRVDREGLGIYVFKRYLQLYEKVEGKTETSRQNAVYQRFTGTKLRTQIFRDFEYPEPVGLPFRHNYKPEALGRRIRRPYPTVYYTPLIPKFDYSDKDTLRVIKMQGSAVVQNPPNPKYPVVGFDIDTLRFKWYPVLRSATGYEVRAFDTVAVDPRFLGYYIYVDAGDPKIDGFYRCVDTGTAIKSSLSNRLYVTGREIFDIDFYAGIGSPDIWRPLQMRFNIAKRKGRLKIYLFPPDYFK